VDLVFLVLLANGHLLEVILVQIVLRLMDVMLALRSTPVPFVLLDIKLMDPLDVLHAQLEITLS